MERYVSLMCTDTQTGEIFLNVEKEFNIEVPQEYEKLIKLFVTPLQLQCFFEHSTFVVECKCLQPNKRPVQLSFF